MYIGRVKRGDWVPLRHIKVNANPGNSSLPSPDMVYPVPQIPDWSDENNIDGSKDPTATVFTADGSVVVDAKKMYQTDPRIHSSLYGVELFIGDDIPEEMCTVLVDYHVVVSYYRSDGEIKKKRDFGHLSLIWTMEVVPSGNAKGAYLATHLYQRPQATFVLGQYDSDTLDFRRNPRK